MTMIEIDIRYLDECFSYEPESGNLVWKDRPREHFANGAVWKASNKKYSGRIAGALDKRGYRQVNVNKKLIFAHRIIWAMTYRRWPKRQIDHINGKTGDNRLCNLRVVTGMENQRNRRQSKNNTTGVTGVSIHSQNGSFTAKIKNKGQTISLGSFQTMEEAAAARQAAERVLGFHKNHGRVS